MQNKNVNAPKTKHRKVEMLQRGQNQMLKIGRNWEQLLRDGSLPRIREGKSVCTSVCASAHSKQEMKGNISVFFYTFFICFEQERDAKLKYGRVELDCKSQRIAVKRGQNCDEKINCKKTSNTLRKGKKVIRVYFLNA